VPGEGFSEGKTGPPRLRIADIAARTGLSTATVSRAMNGKPRISAATRARVLAVLDEIGYVPSGLAASLRTGQTGQLALIIDTPDDPTRLAAMQGAFHAARQAKYGMAVYMIGDEGDRTRTYSQTLARGWVDGALLLWPGRADAPFVRRLRAGGLPMVLIEPEEAVPGLPAVYADAYDDGWRSTRYLLDLGHRRIAACANPAGWGIEGQYLEGYRAALAAAGIAADPALGAAAGWSYEAGYGVATTWLRVPDPPTGLLFRVDMAALGAVAAARDLGRVVPDDLSVIGGDDTQMTQWIKPALTTLRERRSGLTRVACELLLDLVAGRPPPAEPLLVQTAVVVRQSTAPRA